MSIERSKFFEEKRLTDNDVELLRSWAKQNPRKHEFDQQRRYMSAIYLSNCSEDELIWLADAADSIWE